jgi:hypothetical protein
LTRIAWLSMSDTHLLSARTDGVGVDVQLSGQPAQGSSSTIAADGRAAYELLSEFWFNA